MPFFVWTPLIASTDFDGIRTDVLTASTGLITIFLVIAGFAIIIKTFSR